LALSTIVPAHVVVMLAPLVLLFRLNNYGLSESVKVSKTIFLVNMVVMAVTILVGVVYLIMQGANLDHLWNGVELPPLPASEDEHHVRSLPALGKLGFALIPAALGSSILGASGVESVMNIPEELADPRRAVRRIYRWMLSILLIVGGSTAVLLFLVLEPEQLVGNAGYLIATLGQTAFEGVSGLPVLGKVWKVVIVGNAALMLIAATNTGFAGARGLWVTMARDNLLPRFVLKTNERGSFERVHWMMLIGILLLCGQASAETSVLERWYGASFGLVMFSGVVAFILLRKFKAGDRRVYVAKPNFNFGGVSMPISAVIGLAFLSMALLGLYDQYAEQIGALEGLLLNMGIGVGLVLLAYNHRPLIRAAHHYFQRVVETVEEAELETGDDTMVVAVGGARIGRLIRRAMQKARSHGKQTGRKFERLVVFHMTSVVTAEHVYRVTQDSMRPAGLPNNAVRIFTELTQLVAPDVETFLVLVPNPSPDGPMLLAAMDALVDFHERHGLEGHLFMIGDYGVTEDEKRGLAERLEGSTLLAIPV
jgi:amino acid transporter